MIRFGCKQGRLGMPRGAVLLLIGCSWLLTPPLRAAGAQETATRSAADQAALEARIWELIQQLGADQYSTRERAMAELEQFGLEAFDALNEACVSDDIEISLQARYLVRSLQVGWSQERDPPQVRQILKKYGERTPEERQVLMAELAALGAEASLGPLCRLVRYEPSLQLSRRAALLVMGLQLDTLEASRGEVASQLRQGVGLSKRAAADWLRAYADLLEQPSAGFDHWQRIIASEQELLAQSAEDTGRELLRDLLWWYADQQRAAGHEDLAREALQQSLALLDSSRQQLLEAVDWFQSKGAWNLIVAVAEQFPATFKRTPLLLYRLADAKWQLGDHDAADQTAAEARKAVPDEPQEHLMMAANLQHDGLFRWAEQEYRHVAAQMEEQPREAATAKLFLSEMLHDTGAHQQAGDILAELVQAAESDEALRKTVESDLARDLGSIKSRMYYFYARQLGRQHDVPKQREMLTKAGETDPLDADVLIAMYRLEDTDAAWKQQTRQRIQEAVTQYQQRVAELQKRFNLNRPEQQVLARNPLATACNQLAWLVANTEGDYAEALRHSQQSLRLRPNMAGYYDTLGRCYYALQDYDKAIESQTRAVELEPHSPQINAQLELFRTAKAAAAPHRSADEDP